MCCDYNNIAAGGVCSVILGEGGSVVEAVEAAIV